MSFFIFTKDLDNIEDTIYKIAENQSDLNNLNISTYLYKIIEDSQENFEATKYGIKQPVKYNGNVISYSSVPVSYTQVELSGYVNNFKNNINLFLNNNPNHPLFNTWKNYYNQLNSLNLNSISYPLNMSLEQYFKDQSLTSLNPLQLP
jgi:hypothetical protein